MHGVTEKTIIGMVFGEAAKSNVEKRKVGCVIMDSEGVVSSGYNTNDLHAEVMALQTMPNIIAGKAIIYVSHTPCPDCAERILRRLPGSEVVVVEQFMKFDGDKLRYDLVPPSSMLALASVLTFGARKYKPNNWQNCTDLDRYVAATYRHLELWRGGEATDTDSGYPHLWHAMTNLAFLSQTESSGDN